MAARFTVIPVVALLLFGAALSHNAAQGADAPRAPSCGPAIAAGALAALPQIDVRTLPLDDLGRHELIVRVVRDGPRFCFHYVLDGEPQVVAPTLLTHRGERFAIRLVNEISGPASGATVAASALARCMPAPMMEGRAVMFSGYLNHTIYAREVNAKPIDVNLHLHGFEGPPEQENVFLSTLSRPAHACEYDVTIPRTQPPGTYFYHPHVHGMSGPEVTGGLSGMWIVEPDAGRNAAVDEHDVIIRVRQPGKAFDAAAHARETAILTAIIAVAAPHQRAVRAVPPLRTYDPFNPPAWPSAIPARVGNQMLDSCGTLAERMMTVNGAEPPVTLSVRAGKPQLLRVLNALSNGTKYIRLRDASGASQTMRVVGRDGIPVSTDDANPLARYVPMDRVLLGPTMRADILLTVKPGQKLTLYTDRYCSGPFGAAMFTHDLVHIVGVPSANAGSPPATVASTPLAAADSRALALLRYAHAHAQLVQRRALTYTEYDLPMPSGKKRLQFFITETSNRDFNEHSFWPSFAPGGTTPEHADIVVKQGTIEEWYLFNATMEEHTFHIHQMAFAAEDETPVPVMLDTTVVPPGRMLPNPGDPDFPLIEPGRTRILLDFRHVPRGEFVFHCHMLFHEDNGMMGIIRVV